MTSLGTPGICPNHGEVLGLMPPGGSGLWCQICGEALQVTDARLSRIADIVRPALNIYPDGVMRVSHGARPRRCRMKPQATPDRPASWDEYDEQRAAWLSRLMFGGMVDPPMPAAPPPELPDEDGRR